MNFCSDNHTEICYSSYNCPICELLADLAQLRIDYEAIERDLSNTEDALAYYQAECCNYRSALSNVAPEYLL